MKAKARVMTKSGRKLRFEFECGNHVVRRNLNWQTSPILDDLWKAIKEREADPTSKLSRMGGFDGLIALEQGNNLSIHPLAYMRMLERGC